MANYLYNGVKLPALPEWDKETYPYALITVDGLYGWYILHVFKRFTAYKHHPSVVDTPQWFTLDENADCDSAGGYLQAFCKKGYDEWGELKSDLSDPTTDFIPNIIWASVDIRDYNNALYLSASDPVPVPVTDTDHNARIMGWIVGKRLAAQRGRA